MAVDKNPSGKRDGKPSSGKREGKSRVSNTDNKKGLRSTRHGDVDKRRADRKNSAESFSKTRSENEGAKKKAFSKDSDNAYKGNKPFKKAKKMETQASIDKRVEKDGIRLNKFIANAGICSRRDADKHIVAGSVTVNGKVVDSMGYRVKSTEEVKFDGTTIQAEKKVYVVLNKPKNFITTREDTHGRRTVMDLLSGMGDVRVYPVGRLDRNTTGVLMFTNDGEMTKRLTHPTYGVKKMYHVTLNHSLKQVHLEKILDGLHLEDGSIYVDSVSYVNNAPKTEVGIEISSGKNRIVRRIFESLGYDVVKLDRVMMAGLTKKNIKRGQWRFLTQEEVNFLKMI
ncbi:MAG: rRNA pseudouridine synthase [Flavobacteriales bacterium]|nr:rRNA pseudouridine synthase [Flavobacteriales bacterium]